MSFFQEAFCVKVARECGCFARLSECIDIRENKKQTPSLRKTGTALYRFLHSAGHPSHMGWSTQARGRKEIQTS